MISEWFTSPGGWLLSSYYYYDVVTGSLVRIRLDLERADNGLPSIICKQHRVVGFYNRDFSLTRSNRIFRYDFTNGNIVLVDRENADIDLSEIDRINGERLYAWPIIDYRCYDYTLPSPATRAVSRALDGRLEYHKGTIVTEAPILPTYRNNAYERQITQDDLRAIAERYIGELGSIDIINETGRDRENELAYALLRLADPDDYPPDFEE